MKRRNFIQTSGLSLASLLLSQSIFSCKGSPPASLLNFPREVTAILNGQIVQLSGSQEKWVYQQLQVNLKKTTGSLTVAVQAPGTSLSAVVLKWPIKAKDSKILNDHWERTYGDVSWHPAFREEILPWYFMENTADGTNGFGVKTGTGSFCFWTIAKDSLSLTMDTRSGGIGVQLNDRTLAAAEIVAVQGSAEESAFLTTRRFMAMMCEKPRMPKAPVYGINDWYFTYGSNSADLILEHTNLMMPMAAGIGNRPFSVIDAGWFETAPELPEDRSWGAVDQPNHLFGDMHVLSEKIKKIGMRPGLWTRPLCGSSKERVTRMLPFNAARGKNSPVLDPSIPENLEKIKSCFKLYPAWGYELVKFDYTSYDIFGKWGFQMLKSGSMQIPGWSMYDNSKTNAEIILNLYQQIREASGETYIIGCNTFSHLSAGLFELNRIGDDTSGNEWERTRKMGVNTLAFRSVQQGTFYAADADCVGLTTKVPWDKNKQWMELVAKSGTPLFVSGQPEAIGAEQKEKIKEAFEFASRELPVGEPLDWLQNNVPARWKLNGVETQFNWG